MVQNGNSSQAMPRLTAEPKGYFTGEGTLHGEFPMPLPKAMKGTRLSLANAAHSAGCARGYGDLKAYALLQPAALGLAQMSPGLMLQTKLVRPRKKEGGEGFRLFQGFAFSGHHPTSSALAAQAPCHTAPSRKPECRQAKVPLDAGHSALQKTRMTCLPAGCSWQQ